MASSIAPADSSKPSLPRRPLGATGLKVSVIGFGASPLGSVFESIDEAEGIAAVEEAFALGVNLFDTSPFYGDTKSETVLGRALARLPREAIIVATKVGRYGADTFDFSAAATTASVAASLKRLNLTRLDLVQCHDIEFGDLAAVVGGALPALAALKAQGIVGAVGVTGLPLATLKKVVELAPTGLIDVVLSYCHCCPTDHALDAAVPYFAGRGLGIISASPLSMGLLTPQGPPPWHPAPPALRAAAAAAVAAVTAAGFDAPALALRDALETPGVATHLIGLSTRAQVRVAVASALAASAPPQAAEAAALAEMRALLAPVLGTTWPSGRLENN